MWQKLWRIKNSENPICVYFSFSYTHYNCVPLSAIYFWMSLQLNGYFLSILCVIRDVFYTWIMLLCVTSVSLITLISQIPYSVSHLYKQWVIQLIFFKVNRSRMVWKINLVTAIRSRIHPQNIQHSWGLCSFDGLESYW